MKRHIRIPSKGRKFWTEVKESFPSRFTRKKRFTLKRYKCSVCGRTFYSIIQHISMRTRNSDVEHAKLFIAYYASIGMEAVARDKVRRWIEKHAASMRILGKV